MKHPNGRQSGEFTSKNGLSIALGVILGLGLALFLGNHFTRGALVKQREIVAERYATIKGQSLKALVEAALAAEQKDQLQEMVVTFEKAQEGRVEQARVLMLGGARLLASTREGDAVGERLAREEKPFFDLAKDLKTGIETNHDEGVFRKGEIARDTTEEGLIRVTIPFYHKEKMAGVVQLLSQRVSVSEGEGLALPWTPFLIALLGSGILLAFGASRLEKKLLVGAVALPLLLGLWLTIGNGLELFSTGRQQIEATMASHYKEATAKVAEITRNYGIAWVPEQTNTWDCDIYRRAYGFYDPSGNLSTETILLDLGQAMKPLGNALKGNGVLALLVYLFFAMGWAASTWGTLVEHRGAYAYVSPAMIGMLVLVFFPFFYGVALSFTGQTLYNTDKPLLDIWVGFDNYIDILADWSLITDTADGWVFNYENFYWTAFITICWTVVNVTIGVSVGLALALCLNVPGLRGKWFYRSVFVLPWAIPSYVTALIWKGLFDKQFGPINQMIKLFGGEPIAWFDSVFTSFITGITVNGWLSFPFMMLISLGGLQSISNDMYEAARLDGASKFQQFRYITLPSLKPTLIPAIIISVVWTFNLFNVIYLVSGGDPGGSNEILVTQAYKIAFEKYQYGYAAAYSAVIFIILLTYGIFQNKMSKATEDIKA